MSTVGKCDPDALVVCSNASCGSAYRTSGRAARRIRERGGRNLCEPCRLQPKATVPVLPKHRAWARRVWAEMSAEDRMLVGLALEGMLPADETVAA